MSELKSLKERLEKYFSNDPYISTGKIIDEDSTLEEIKVDQLWHVAYSLQRAKLWVKYENQEFAGIEDYSQRKIDELNYTMKIEYERFVILEYINSTFGEFYLNNEIELADEKFSEGETKENEILAKLNYTAKEVTKIILDWAGEIKGNKITPTAPLI